MPWTRHRDRLLTCKLGRAPSRAESQSLFLWMEGGSERWLGKARGHLAVSALNCLPKSVRRVH